MDRLDKLRGIVRDFPDFPKKGILFRDIFPIFENWNTVNDMIDLIEDHLVEKFGRSGITAFVGLEARGFLLGPLLAQKFKCAFVPVRKQGKLPGKCIQDSYSLEYGEATNEMQSGALSSSDKVVIIDDLLATGGTLQCACNLVQQLGAKILESVVIIELVDLNGRKNVKDSEIFSLLQF